MKACSYGLLWDEIKYKILYKNDACNCFLKFKPDEKTREFGPKEMKSYKLLKRQFSNFKEGFSSYQEYKTKSNIHK